MKPLLMGEGLRKSYGGREVLSIDRLQINRGETLCLMGANGAGKSTLIRLLNLVEKPDAGELRFEGKKASTGDLDLRRRMAGVFQRPHMFAGSVTDNVTYGLKIRRIDKSQIRDKTDAVLKAFGLMELAGHEARKLSGGEAQRVALARAVVVEPDILFLDEPASFMDTNIRARLFQYLRTIKDLRQTTIIFVTHSEREAREFADRVVLLEHGRIREIDAAN